MEKLLFKNLAAHFGETIEICGFVDKVRDLQYVQFVVVRDSSGKVQITIEKNDANKAMNETVSKLTKESTIRAVGVLYDRPNVKLRGMEFIPTEFEVTSLSAEELPIDILDYTNATNKELRLDYRFLDLRTDRNYLIFKAQTIAEMGMREWWVSHNFIEIHSPKILGTASESGAEVFKMDYFGRTVYLAQSPQFYKQMAMASGFNGVFEIAPAFRAENSHTAFHATEFTSVDAETSWIKSHHDVMDMEEEVVKAALRKVKDVLGKEYLDLMKKDVELNEMKWPRIPFAEVKRIIQEHYKYVGEKPTDIDRREEELIGMYVKKNFGCDFVFVTEYPFAARPFYHMLDENGLTKSFDLLYKGVEITTGAQREHRIEILRQQATMKGLGHEALEFYFNFFKYGVPPHGGFGFGLTRFLMRLFEAESIRDVTLLYRGPNRVNP